MFLRYAFKALIVISIGVAAYLLFQTVQHYSLGQIMKALLALPLNSLGLAFVFAALSYASLSLFDALGMRYIGKPLPLWQTSLTSFISLSIGHNVGMAALSSAAIRYRFYSRWGLSSGDVGLIVIFCGTTVVLGLSTLGAAALLLRPQDAEALTGLGEGTIAALAAGAASLPVLYLILAAVFRRPLTIRGHKLYLPSFYIAVLQVIIGTVNFAFVSASLHQVLSAISQASYIKVAAISIIANVAAIISHVPGGFGVLEATVSYILPGAKALAAVIAFRVIYYFVPLLLGLLLFGIYEIVANLPTRSTSTPEDADCLGRASFHKS